MRCLFAFYYCFMFIYAFASCFIAWFPGIVPVGPFLLAEVRPPTVSSPGALDHLIRGSPWVSCPAKKWNYVLSEVWWRMRINWYLELTGQRCVILWRQVDSIRLWVKAALISFSTSQVQWGKLSLLRQLNRARLEKQQPTKRFCDPKHQNTKKAKKRNANLPKYL